METTTIHSDYELERGKPMPSKNHAQLQHRLNVLLLPFTDRFDIMTELGLELPSGKAVPDVCLYPKQIYDWEKDEVRMTAPPVTTIEILSPTQAVNDLVEKIRAVYFPASVKSAWIILPPLKTLYIFYPDRPTETFTHGLVKDAATAVELRMEDLFK
ncbi:MAG: Uma2 family endonuclease [Rhizobacter sp.]|nr:Uma2 family endonuclease [Chlorobiales bacterium]